MILACEMSKCLTNENNSGVLKKGFRTFLLLATTTLPLFISAAIYQNLDSEEPYTYLVYPDPNSEGNITGNLHLAIISGVAPLSAFSKYSGIFLTVGEPF